jgi:HemY protein
MRLFLWLFALIAMAIGLAVTARFNPGNVVLFYPPYRVDLSLNLFLVLAGFVFLLLYASLRAIRTTQKMPSKVAAYRQRKREREGNKALREALKKLFEGRFGHAEKAAQRASELGENAALAALIGARAAHSMRQPERRDTWLARIGDDSSYKSARLMTMIELLVEDHKAEAALAAVRELNASGTRHIHAQLWALKANQRAKNWPEVLRLVRMLDKRKALHPALSARLRELAYEDLLGDRSHDAESIRLMWADIPFEDRQKPFVAARAAHAFNVRGLHEEASALVEKALANAWDERLVRAYRESAAGEATPLLLAQIEKCEAWHKQYPADPELTLTLGSLCLKQKLWGKAQRYLQLALSDASEGDLVRETHLKLAQLHEALNQFDQAAAHYRQCALASIL